MREWRGDSAEWVAAGGPPKSQLCCGLGSQLATNPGASNVDQQNATNMAGQRRYAISCSTMGSCLLSEGISEGGSIHEGFSLIRC